MKQILPLLFLFYFLVFPHFSFAVIEFQISNFQKVNSFYSVDAVITGAATGSAYYVQAMFTKPDPVGYFGYTWSQKGEWVKYLSSPEPDYIKSNFPVLASGQKQTFLIMPDTESSKYSGPGEYLLKLKRYTGESTSGTYSNSLTVSLADPAPEIRESPTPTPTSVPTVTTTAAPPTPTPMSTSTSTPTPKAIKTPTGVITKTPVIPAKAGIQQNNSSESSLILGESSSSGNISFYNSSDSATPIIENPENSKTEVKTTAFYKNSFIIGVLIAAISGGLLYFRIRNR